jgi:hypothetical protein
LEARRFFEDNHLLTGSSAARNRNAGLLSGGIYNIAISPFQNYKN